MDTFTHALSGALLARATAPRQEDANTLPLRRRLLIGFLAAAAPDLDFLYGYLGPVDYLLNHRGITHSLILLPLWAFLLAKLGSVIWRRDRPWHAYFGIIVMGLGIHIAGDWITSYGTMVLAPLSDARFGIGTTFIIDLWLTGIIATGLSACWVWRATPMPAIAGLATLCGYIAFQGLLQQRAIEWGEAYAQMSGMAQAAVTAQARPVSPFNWLVIVRSGEEVRYTFVNLARREPLRVAPDASVIRQLDAAYLPLAQAQWVFGSRYGTSDADRAIAREVWAHPQFAFFRWFADEPMFLRADAGSPPSCAWFQDLRFFTPGRGAWPFRFGLCREQRGPWRLYQLDAEERRIPMR
jgi:inner membrane protein